jgi:hypothetical protein
MKPLPDTGTYTIVVDPGALTGSLTLTLSEPVTDTITIAGPPVLVIIDKPGQDARVTFEGTAGQRVDLGVSEVSFATGLGAVEVSILHPDRTTLDVHFVNLSPVLCLDKTGDCSHSQTRHIAVFPDTR